jgi:RNase P/RNase MRP subunit p30
VVFPDPARTSTDRLGYKVIELPRLIELKLASGLTDPLRLRDLADVLDLIRALDLPRDLADEIDSSVRHEYLRMWDAAANARDPQAE